MKILAAIVAVWTLWLGLYLSRPSFKDPLSAGAAVLGTALFVSFAAFVVSSLICQFFIDRAKVAEAKAWLPIGYTYPPKKYLKQKGHIIADIRYISGILSFVLIVGVLICAR